MRGSHAPSLRTLVDRALRTEARVERGTALLCACSGGPDSNAMLHVVAGLREALGLRLFAHGVDHGLRADAASELAVAAAVAGSVGVPFDVTRVDVPRGGNLMARARAARYTALRTAAAVRGAELVATAHTADDRAETVLMRILRGAGPRGLSVLPVRSGDLLRPLIRARRDDVLKHLRRHRVPFAEDPSNLDGRFLRVRVRREVMPLLVDLSPRLVESLCALSDALGELPVDDDPLGFLGRRQRQAVTAALSAGKRGVRVRLDERKEVWIDVTEGRVVVKQVEATRRRR